MNEQPPKLHPDVLAEIIGTPLLPLEATEPPPTEGIRAYAPSVINSVVRRVVGLSNMEAELDGNTLSAIRHVPVVKTLTSRLQVANDTWANLHNPPDMPEGSDASDVPRAIFQADALHSMVMHMQGDPGSGSEPTGRTGRQLYNNGYLTVAPVAAGKTPLQALILNYAGVGKPINEVYPQKRLGVGILTSQVLLEQYLNPDGPFQRFLHVGGRDIRVGAYYQNRRDGHREYDLMLTTPQSIETAVSKGAIKLESTVVYALDEAHRSGMAPRMQRHLGRVGTSIQMFTATPAYNERRDLRLQYPHSQFGSMRSFIEDGILSPIRLYTYRATKEPDSANKIALSLAEACLASGRKTLIVCEAGGKSKQARELAAALNQRYQQGLVHIHPDLNFEGDEIAAAVGSFKQPLTRTNIERLKHNQLLVASTVATAREGLDIPDLEALIIIGYHGADWETQQWLGRVLRSSRRIAIASEILPETIRPGKPQASIFNPFDFEPGQIIEPGYYVGPKVERSLAHHKPTVAPDVASSHDATLKTEFSESSREPETFQVPASLLGKLVTGVSLREATVSSADIERQPPPDYLPLTTKVPEGVKIRWLYSRLDNLNDPEIRYVGVMERMDDGKREYVRYYSPAAHAYFDKHPVPELAADTEYGVGQVAELFSVSIHYIQKITDELGIELLTRIHAKNQAPGKKYSLEHITMIGERVEETPLAAETDVPVYDLRKLYGYGFVSDYVNDPTNHANPLYMRRNPLFGYSSIARHISESAVLDMKRAYDALEVVDLRRFMSRSEIALRSGRSLTVVMKMINQLDEEDSPQMYTFCTKPKGRTREYMTRQWGEAYADHIKLQKLQPWEATTAIVGGYFGITAAAATDRLRHRKYTPERKQLVGSNGQVSVYPFSAIVTLLNEGLKPAAGMPRIMSIDHIATSPKQAKAQPQLMEINQLIQSQFVDQSALPAPAEALENASHVMPSRELSVVAAPAKHDGLQAAWISSREALNSLNCTEAALRVLVGRYRSEFPKKESVRRNDANQIDGIAADLVNRAELMDFETAPDGWISQDRILASQKGAEKMSKRPAQATPVEQNLYCSPVTHVLDVYYSPVSARILMGLTEDK
jgi:hypothetical protein